VEYAHIKEGELALAEFMLANGYKLHSEVVSLFRDAEDYVFVKI
jgi:hypothetical protein